MSLEIGKGANLSEEGSTFLQAGDNTTTWCLYYLENILMLLLLESNNQTYLRIGCL